MQTGLSGSLDVKRVCRQKTVAGNAGAVFCFETVFTVAGDETSGLQADQRRVVVVHAALEAGPHCSMITVVAPE